MNTLKDLTLNGTKLSTVMTLSLNSPLKISYTEVKETFADSFVIETSSHDA